MLVHLHSECTAHHTEHRERTQQPTTKPETAIYGLDSTEDEHSAGDSEDERSAEGDYLNMTTGTATARTNTRLKRNS